MDSVSWVAMFSIFVFASLVVTVLGCGCVKKTKEKGAKQTAKKATAKGKKGAGKVKKGLDNVKKASSPKAEVKIEVEKMESVKEGPSTTAPKPDVKSLAPKAVKMSIRPAKSVKPAMQVAEENPPNWEVPAFSVVTDKDTNDTILDMAGQQEFKPTLLCLPTSDKKGAETAKKYSTATKSSTATKKSSPAAKKDTIATKKDSPAVKGSTAAKKSSPAAKTKKDSPAAKEADSVMKMPVAKKPKSPVSVMPMMLTAKPPPNTDGEGKGTYFVSARAPSKVPKKKSKNRKKSKSPKQFDSVRPDGKKGTKGVVSILV